MDYLLSFVASIAGFSIFSSLFSILFPDGKMKKVGRFILSITMLFLFLNPISKAIKQPTKLWNFDDSLENKIEAETTHQKDIYENTLKGKIKSKLSELKIDITDISLETEYSNDNYLLLKKLDLEVPSIYKKDVILQILEKEFEIPSEIVNIHYR